MYFAWLKSMLEKTVEWLDDEQQQKTEAIMLV